MREKKKREEKKKITEKGRIKLNPEYGTTLSQLIARKKK